jgi:hypothetical protein
MAMFVVKISVVISFIIKYKCMEDKDKIIASLRKQLKEAVSRCNALEQENALLSYQLEKMEERCPESH